MFAHLLTTDNLIWTFSYSEGTSSLTGTCKAHVMVVGLGWERPVSQAYIKKGCTSIQVLPVPNHAPMCTVHVVTKHQLSAAVCLNVVCILGTGNT